MASPKRVAGVMELLPFDQLLLEEIIKRIKSVFIRFGFLPISTPLFEFKETLLKKNSLQTQKQIYFLSSSGSIKRDKPPKYAVRYDLTVPLARYVAQNQEKLLFPFKRFQIQKVYRGESPQAGRYREFYQCDADVIGKNKLSFDYDGEMGVIIYTLLNSLFIDDFTIFISNRNFFKALFYHLKIEDENLGLDIIRTIDKSEKFGSKFLEKSLEKSSLNKEQIISILDFVKIKEKNSFALKKRLNSLGISNSFLNDGLQQLESVIEGFETTGVPDKNYEINLKIARGLDYYTGNIFEAVLNSFPELGSICSGGRYEDLVQSFSKLKSPGVGISLGLTRLFNYIKKNKITKFNISSPIKVMIANFGYKFFKSYKEIAKELRSEGVNTLIYFQQNKPSKQFRFASASGIKFVLILGENEEKRDIISIKDIDKKEQRDIDRNHLCRYIKEKLNIIKS